LPQVIKKTQQTHTLADQGKGPYESSLGERAYTLDSPDHCRLYNRSPPATTEETEQPPQPTEMLPKPQDTPTYFYCCKYNSNKLGMVNLLTGELSWHQVPGYLFKELCRWSELPGGTLLITGDEGPKEVVKIDTLRELAVSFQPVQKLSLDSLTWQLMQLPQADCYFTCFKTDTEVYLVIKETLYTFNPLQIKPVRTLDRSCVPRVTTAEALSRWVRV
jgi:hypothetical protein